MKTASTYVRENIGKVAFIRGPITYCMEEIDNGKNLHLCRVDVTAIGDHCKNVRIEKNSELGHEMAVLKVPGLRQPSTDAEKEVLYTDYKPQTEEKVTLTLVPYYAWNNRGEGEMSVWVRV